MSEKGDDLLATVPAVRRARGFRLYLADGRRLVDLWQYGGAAVLGHTAPGVLLAFKNTASRGLFAPFPHAAAARLEKALRRLAPDCAEVRLYANEASADAALLEAALSTAALSTAALSTAAPLRYRDFADPARIDLPPGVPASLWRPWAPPSEFPSPPILAPVIPLPWPSRPIALLLDGTVAGRLPPSDVLSPVVLAAACRAVEDLIAALPLRDSQRRPRLEAALGNAGSPWRMRGPYFNLAAPTSAAAYAALFRRFLEKGFLLPPDPASQAILPLDLSPGEEAALAALLCRSPSEIL